MLIQNLGLKDIEMEHVKQRFKERFGKQLTDKIKHDLIEKIRLGRGIFVKRKTNIISVWDIEYKGMNIRVYYNKKKGSIATIINKGKE